MKGRKMTTQTKTTNGRGKRYPATVRLNALKRIESGESVNSVSKTTGVANSTLAYWRQASKTTKKTKGKTTTAPVTSAQEDANDTTNYEAFNTPESWFEKSDLVRQNQILRQLVKTLL